MTELLSGGVRRVRPRSPEPDRPRWMRRFTVKESLKIVWGDWRLGASVASLLAAAYGLLNGWLIPRGPLTTFAALSSIGASAVVGATAALVMRSRWAMLLAPAVFVGMFELTRVSSVGPTVDAIHLGSTYGILAFAVGRGFHGVLAIFPMAVAAAFGAGVGRLARSGATARSASKFAMYGRRGVAIVAASCVLLLGLAVARPAGTNPIRDANGKRVAGSIAELTRVNIGGHQLSMMIRGTSSKSPILLFLAGGPGGSELGAMRKHLKGLERDFLVVTWDQRGTGKSYDQLEPVKTLTFDNAMRDTTEVTNYLRGRFGQDKIYLAGQSYGTFLGVRAVQQHPELYAAYIGVGQMVSAVATDRIYFDDTLAWARKNGRSALVTTLTKIGPPPYAKALNYESVLSNEQEVYPYDHRQNSEGAGGFSENIFVREYSLVQQVHNLAGFLDVFSIVYPQIQNIDFRTDAPKLNVPVYLVQGGHETRGRVEPLDQWLAKLDAPVKRRVIFESSGHRSMFEQPDQFIEFMTKTVLVDTAKRPS